MTRNCDVFSWSTPAAAKVDAARTHVVTAPQAVNSTGTNRTPLRFMTAYEAFSMARTISLLRPAGIRSRPSGSHGDRDAQLPVFHTCPWSSSAPSMPTP